MPTALTPSELYRQCDPADIPFETTDEAQEIVEIIGQARALDAVRFAVGMRRDGYNIFALGPEGIGKQTLLRQFLGRQAPQQRTPSDWCYISNLAEPHRPRALQLPPGMGARLRSDMTRMIAELRVAMPAAFESDEYRSRKHQLVHDFKHHQEETFEELQKRARSRRVAVVRTDTGFALAAVRSDNPDSVIAAAEFEKLPQQEQDELRAAMDDVGREIAAMFLQFQEQARAHHAALAALDRDFAAAVTRRVIDSIREVYRELPAVLDYLAGIERDVTDNFERFTAKSEEGIEEAVRHALHQDTEQDQRFHRYEVNVMIDHGAAHGAPIVYEGNPTYTNLVGRIEHVPQLGALVTDFTLIRPGALHRATGGYLLIDAIKVLAQPFAWEALKRALKTREIRIESLGQVLGLVSTVSLEPQPIPLDGTKVVLLGERLLYYLLSALDPEFDELFKVMVDFEQCMDRRRDVDTQYACLIAGMVRREALRPFDRGAIARVIEHASRLAQDAQKLSVHLRPIVDLLHEADYWAGLAGRAAVAADDVQAAIDARLRRAGRLRERMLEAIRRDTILIETSGGQIGQVNGLSVIELGGSTFGHPTRITARVRVGKGEVVDIEREVKLGGPIHSKGVLILGGLVGARYAQRTPLSLSATIVFEQSYAGVEGDSASLAELCALLSAIADVPLKQSLAVTGSVNQHGQIQPVGGINEKIEGFFDVCRDRGLTGEHGVVIPRGNVQHLMLRKDVAAAVAAHRFAVYAVSDLDDALALLTDRDAGARDASGRFLEGSVNACVEARLAAFAEDARRFLLRQRDELP